MTYHILSNPFIWSSFICLKLIINFFIPIQLIMNYWLWNLRIWIWITKICRNMYIRKYGYMIFYDWKMEYGRTLSRCHGQPDFLPMPGVSLLWHSNNTCRFCGHVWLVIWSEWLFWWWLQLPARATCNCEPQCNWYRKSDSRKKLFGGGIWTL